VVRCTFSPARAWRPAVGYRLARTLGFRFTLDDRGHQTMPKRPKHPPPAEPIPVSPDLHKAWLDRLKANPITAAVILAVPVILGALALVNGLTTIPSVLNRFWQGSVATYSTGLYIFEVANKRSETERILVEEVRDVASGCRVLREELAPNVQGLWASPGPGGARATLMLKIYIKNALSEKLTNVRLFLSPTNLPFDFTTISATPNISVKMSRPPSSQGGLSPYLVEIDNLAVEDFGVVTLSSALTRANAQQIAATKFRIAIMSIRADQFPTAEPRMKEAKFDAKSLYLEEGIKTTGHPGYSFSSNVEFVPGTKPPAAEDFSFLSPPRQCNE
jgi:hypothetical protein